MPGRSKRKRPRGSTGTNTSVCTRRSVTFPRSNTSRTTRNSTPPEKPSKAFTRSLRKTQADSNKSGLEQMESSQEELSEKVAGISENLSVYQRSTNKRFSDAKGQISGVKH